MCEVPNNCADCCCTDEPKVWGDIDLRLEALQRATMHGNGYLSSADIVARAAAFYNFLNGDLITSNIDKLDAIADILADE